MPRNRDTDYNNYNENNNNNNNYNKFERKISRLFDDFLNDVGFTRTHGSKFRDGGDKHSNWSPAIDIKEADREYLVLVDVPGVRKEDIDIEFHDSVLTLSGHLNQDIFSTPHAQEINVGKDNRQHSLQQPQQHQQPQQYQQQPQQYQQQPQQYQQQPQQYQQQQQPQQYQQQPQQYQQQQPQPYQQSTEPQHHQQSQQPQQSTEPQKYQQSTEPQKYQQPTEAQQYQQAVDQKYNLSNEPQQQSNEYQHVKGRHQREPRGDRFHIQERPYGHFSRSVQLPSNIKSEDEFLTTLENGVLKIIVPKNNDKPKRKITIK